MKFTQSSHCVYYAEYHVCWCTKYRRKILNPGVAGYLRKTLMHSVRTMVGVRIAEIGIDDKMRDHVHIVIQIPPRYSRSEVIGKIKVDATQKLRKRYKWMGDVYWKENVVWSTGFFLSTVGVNKEVIRNYVRWQGKQDSDQAQLNLFDSTSL